MDLKFLRLSSTDNYNSRMGDIDIADQKFGSYQLDKFMRKIKQSWPIWIQRLSILLVNCYIYYIIYLESKDINKKNILLQYEF